MIYSRSEAKKMKPNIFIDGEAGTTGLQIRERLKGCSSVNFISLDDVDRKKPAKRAEALNDCDLAILCLPDEAAQEAVSFIKNEKVRVLDASSAHRTNTEWAYGLPEISLQQSEKITNSRLVSNPGCYPTGLVAMLAPLISAGLMKPDFQVIVSATSGYSGAGKSLIQRYEDEANFDYIDTPYSAYDLHLEHKHIHEMQAHAGLELRPFFLPAIGRYRQGILMRVPIITNSLTKSISCDEIRQVLVAHYAESRFISVVDNKISDQIANLTPITLNGSNNLEIYIFHHPEYNQIVLTAVYDNLGKGASGAAVQNMYLMLGITEYAIPDLGV